MTKYRSNSQQLKIDLTHLIIISCLPELEDFTEILALELNDIRASSSRADQSEVQRVIISEPDELKNELVFLAKQFESFETHNGLTLLIQGHGNDIFTEVEEFGLFVGKHDNFISWIDLQPYFSRLNRATGAKLGLCISTCFGYSVISSLVNSIQFNCAPFRYFIGSFAEENDVDLESFWLQLFSNLFQDKEIQSVFAAYPSISIESIERQHLKIFSKAELSQNKFPELKARCMASRGFQAPKISMMPTCSYRDNGFADIFL